MATPDGRTARHWRHLQAQRRQAECNCSIAQDTPTIQTMWAERLRHLDALQGILPESQQPSSEAPPKESLQPNIYVLVHGNNSTPADFDKLARCLYRSHAPDECVVLQSAGNTGYLTRRGIAVCGTVLAIEVLDFLLRYDVDPTQPRQLSIVGHSFGGLIARYSLVLLQHILSALCITPVSFATLCTPHLGSRRPGGGMWKRVVQQVVHGVLSIDTLYGQTGRDLLLEGEPYSVLERMSHPDSPFVAALKRFRHRTLVGLIHGDHLVPHASSCLTTVVPEVPRVEPAQSWQWTLVHSGIDKSDATLGGFAQVNLVEMEASSTRQYTADRVEFDVHQRAAINRRLLRVSHLVTWRRLHLRLDCSKVHWKKAHDWPIGRNQPPDSRSLEFLQVFASMLVRDHLGPTGIN